MRSALREMRLHILVLNIIEWDLILTSRANNPNMRGWMNKYPSLRPCVVADGNLHNLQVLSPFKWCQTKFKSDSLKSVNLNVAWDLFIMNSAHSKKEINTNWPYFCFVSFFFPNELDFCSYLCEFCIILNWII